MARRPSAGVGRALAAGHEIDRGQRGVGGSPRRLPGAGPDRSHRVVSELARARCRIRRPAPVPARRAFRAWGRGTGRPCPARDPAAGQPPAIAPRRLRGNSEARHRGPRAGCDRSARRLRSRSPREPRARRGSGLPLRDLGGGGSNAHPDLGVRLVQTLAVAPDDRHRDAFAHRRHPNHEPARRRCGARARERLAASTN